jgi:hypothetical protein
MSKPTNKPGWSSTGVEPSSTKKSQGWAAGEKPSAAQMNWLFKTVSEWIEHVDADQVKGDTGDAGPQGEKGVIGDTGAQGIRGIKGEIGDAGPQGSKGLAGDQGPQGATGSAALDATTEARIAALESKARISTPSSVTMALSYQGTGVASEYNAGNSGSAITVDWSNGVSQVVTVNSNTTVSFTNPTNGKVYYLRLKSDGVADRNLTFVGANPSISSVSRGYTAIISLYYDGSAYVVQKITSLFGPVSGSETKNGYIAGGFSGGSSGGTFFSTIQKINFNLDLKLSVIQGHYASAFTSVGQIGYPKAAAITDVGQGTQSLTSGYQAITAYLSTLVSSGSSSTTTAWTKMPFSTESSAVLRTALTSSFPRRAVMQTTQNAYLSYASTTTTFTHLKHDFLTDSQSTFVTTISGMDVITTAAQNRSGGLSSLTEGIHWTDSAFTKSYKIVFSNETPSLLTNTNSVQVGSGEAIDDSQNGYMQHYPTTGSVSPCHKMNKTNYTQSVLSQLLSGGATSSAATQGTANGYFCGGTTFTGTSTANLGQTTIKKLQFSPELFSIHSAGLNLGSLLAAGFEG